MNFISIALLSVLSLSSTAQAKDVDFSCEKEINQFLTTWDLGTVDNPKDYKKMSESPNGDKVGHFGNPSGYSEKQLAAMEKIKTEKQFSAVFPEKTASKGGVYQQQVTVQQYQNIYVKNSPTEFRISRGGVVKSQPPESPSVSARDVTDMIVTLDKNCKFKEASYPRKKPVADKSGKIIRAGDTFKVTAATCKKINEIKADGEVLDAEIDKLLNDPSIHLNPDHLVMNTPYDSIKGNCRSNGLFAKLLPSKIVEEVRVNPLDDAPGVQKGR